MDIIDKDKGFAELFVRVKALASKPYFTVGVFSDEKHEDSDISVAEIALIHEFGTETLPERSYLRSTFDEKRDMLNREAEKLLPSVIFGGMTTGDMLSKIGEKLLEAVKHKITVDGIKPSDSPATLAAKESKGRGDVTLVDSQQMLDALTCIVVTNGGK